MRPDINTKFIALLGTPLSQSYAADMQNSAYEAMGENIIYFYEEMDETHLKAVVNGLRYMNFAGFAVTKPNKIAVMEYLDETDPLCALIGACNTVVKKGERLIGYNTDAVGFLRSLQGAFPIKGSSCYCFGAGGVGRAMCSALAMHGADRLIVYDTDEALASALVERLNDYRKGIAVADTDDGHGRVRDCDLVINATGLGVRPHVGESPLPEQMFDRTTFYFDAGYNPAKTQFLEYAEQAGARYLNGLDMSIYQGVEQIKLWTGKIPPVELMRDIVLHKVSEQSGQKVRI